MNFARCLRGGARRRISIVTMALAFVASVFSGAIVASPAAAAGQLDIWGTWGADPGQLSAPTVLGYDPTDGPGGSVYVGGVLDLETFRVQKFTSAGVFKGSVDLPTPPEGGRRRLQGIVVDPNQDRFYLLEFKNGVDTVAEKPAARSILAFSTEPNGSGELVPATPATLPVPDPEGSAPLDNPREFARDPASGDLLISAEDRDENFVLQRIVTAGAGSIGARYTETTNVTGVEDVEVLESFTVGPDGTVYIAVANTGTVVGAPNRLWTLPPSLVGPPTESPASPLPPSGGPAFVHQPNPGATVFGSQIAISADGDTLYLKEERLRDNQEPAEAGAYRVRGYSLHDESTTALYGDGAAEQCAIETRTAALAPAGDDLIVLDQGPLVLEEPAYGAHVLRFGPGGSNCPAPVASFDLTVAGTPVSTVGAGTSVTLDGSASTDGQAPLASTPESITWKIEGPGGPFEQTVLASAPNPEKLDHVFGAPGEYTVRMIMNLSDPGIDPGVIPFTTLHPRELEVTEASQAAPTVANSAPGTVTQTTAVLKGTVDNDADPSGSTCKFVIALESSPGTAVAEPACTVTPVMGDTATAVEATAGSLTAGTKYVYRVVAQNSGGAATGTPDQAVETSAPAQPAPTVTNDAPGTITQTSIAMKGHVDNEGAAAGSTCKFVIALESSPGTAIAEPACAPSPVMGDTSTAVGATAAGLTAGTKYVYRVVAQNSGGTTTGTPDRKVTTTQPPPPQRQLTVSKAGGGTGTVTSSPGGIDCGATCSASFADGVSVTLSAKAGSESSFAGWGGACSGTGACVVSMTAAKSVTANFDAVAKPKPLPDSCATNPTLCPKPPEPPLTCKAGFVKKTVGGTAKCVPKPKPLTCKKGFKKKKVKGKLKCVKVKARGLKGGKGNRPATDWIFAPANLGGLF